LVEADETDDVEHDVMQKDFLGIGWRFPVALDEQGQIEAASHDQSITQSIWTILSTAPGERVMLPEFGCGIHQLVFSSGTAATTTQAAEHVRRALARWEPRVILLHVATTHERAADGSARLLIEIDYRVRMTNNRFNLVYPFYLE
jgi:phage baseplate assembly protein W